MQSAAVPVVAAWPFENSGCSRSYSVASSDCPRWAQAGVAADQATATLASGAVNAGRLVAAAVRSSLAVPSALLVEGSCPSAAAFALVVASALVAVPVAVCFELDSLWHFAVVLVSP